MTSHELTPDGVVRRDGRVAEDVPSLDLGPVSLGVLRALSDQDQEAAQRFVRVGQTPAGTYLTGRLPSQ